MCVNIRSDSISHLSSISNDGGRPTAVLSSSSSSSSTAQQQQVQQQQQQRRSKSRTDDMTTTTTTTTTSASPPVKYKPGSTPLKFTRQSYRNLFIMTVMSNVECTIEIIKSKGGSGGGGKKQQQLQSGIVEVIRFQFDVDLVTVYKSKEPLAVNEHAPYSCPHGAPSYSLDRLPAAYWSKYTTACKFMMLIRSKTPKITLYTERAKAVLYDSSDDFDVQFYADSTRFVYSKDTIKITAPTGTYFILSLSLSLSL